MDMVGGQSIRISGEIVTISIILIHYVYLQQCHQAWQSTERK